MSNASRKKNQREKPPGKPSTAQRSWTGGRALLLSLAALLALVTVGVYAQSSRYEFIAVDDNLYVAQNSHVQAGLTVEGVRWAFTATVTGNWHPWTWISLMADYSVSGLNPGTYHVTNLVLHALNVLLVLLLFHRMTGHLWRSTCLAALFALHPLHVESVAWISERKDVLSTLFWLLGIWAYLHYRSKPSVGRYATVGCALVMALMAKPMPVSFPFTLLLLDVWPLQRIPAGPRSRRVIGRLIFEKAPLFLISAASCFLTFWAQKSGGAVARLDQLPLYSRAANALVSYVSYLVKMVWPVDLALFYPYPATSPEMWQVASCMVGLAVISCAAIRAFPGRAYITFGWLWYVITLVPVIGVVQIGSQALADRYTYVPSIGIFAIAVWGGHDLCARYWAADPRGARKTPGILGPVMFGILLCLGALSYRQVRVWKDDITAWAHAIAVTHPNAISEYNLARAFDTRNRYEEAIVHYRDAVRLDPRRSEALNNLAVLLMEKQSYDEAESALRSALGIRPDFAEAHTNMGILLCRQQRFGEGFRHFRDAMQWSPEDREIRRKFASAQCDYGIWLAGSGNMEEAVRQFQAALETDPGLSMAHFDLGLTYARLKRPDRAQREYEQAILADPGCVEAHNNLGLLLGEAGKIDEALAHFQAALRLRPEYQPAADNLRVFSALRKGRR
jgi:protein O-mannosyl-transferase